MKLDMSNTETYTFCNHNYSSFTTQLTSKNTVSIECWHGINLRTCISPHSDIKLSEKNYVVDMGVVFISVGGCVVHSFWCDFPHPPLAPVWQSNLPLPEEAWQTRWHCLPDQYRNDVCHRCCNGSRSCGTFQIETGLARWGQAVL